MSAGAGWLAVAAATASHAVRTGRSDRKGLASELSDCLPDDAILVADTGFSATGRHSSTEFRRGQRYLRVRVRWAGRSRRYRHGLRRSGAPVVCFTGDGALYYHLGELETLRRWNLPWSWWSTTTRRSARDFDPSRSSMRGVRDTFAICTLQ